METVIGDPGQAVADLLVEAWTRCYLGPAPLIADIAAGAAPDVCVADLDEVLARTFVPES